MIRNILLAAAIGAALIAPGFGQGALSTLYRTSNAQTRSISPYPALPPDADLQPMRR